MEDHDDVALVTGAAGSTGVYPSEAADHALVNGRTLVTRDSPRVSPGITPVVAGA
ncbi:hypothetical protein SAMN04488066_1342 [Halorubrum aquaticum]|uniref:Uncharacterized protein n=1 Tax=Halorubrum aquaticum TaxID=387340 RepID=A0A1I3CXI0_9EURY|nr:hypothetical protein SAMN04488066_1342 [Halorubrum aquaticum]